MTWDFIRFIFGHPRRSREAAEPGVDALQEMPVRIERMRLDDLDGVMEVEHLSYETPWSRRAFVSEVTENAYAHYFCAKQGAKVVGYIGMWLILDEAHITNVAVHPDFRSMGIGRMLMENAIGVTEAHGCPKITLEVRRHNLIAQSLYRSLGFQMAGVRKGYYTDNGEDAFIMVRDTQKPFSGED